LSPLTFSPSAGYNRADVITLALDTTTPSGSLALARGHDVLLARGGDPSRPYGERLPGAILALLGEAGVGVAEVSLYAVATGPGAFTGLRIGIAAIQGLAFAHGRPVVGISALDALALAASAGLARGTRLGAWMDAARQEVFAALYEVPPDSMAPGLTIIDAPSVGAPEAVIARWSRLLDGGSAALAGEGAIRYRAPIERALPGVPIVETWPPIAGAMIPLALDAAARGLAGPPHALRPLYVRRPDAEIARDLRAASVPDAG
jgi:tRNA threonylcarbamoyladenosine biosynthesis protein TsaB